MNILMYIFLHIMHSCTTHEKVLILFFFVLSIIDAFLVVYITHNTLLVLQNRISSERWFWQRFQMSLPLAPQTTIKYMIA